MRLKLSDLSLPLAVGLLAFGLSTPAQAESSYSDRIYADSFGNLVVHSRSGSKRIVVGAGRSCAGTGRLRAAGRDRTDIAYAESGEESVPYECWKPAVLLKGRSYMYGLRGRRTARPARKMVWTAGTCGAWRCDQARSALISSRSCPRLVGRGGS